MNNQTENSVHIPLMNVLYEFHSKDLCHKCCANIFDAQTASLRLSACVTEWWKSAPKRRRGGKQKREEEEKRDRRGGKQREKRRSLGGPLRVQEEEFGHSIQGGGCLPTQRRGGGGRGRGVQRGTGEEKTVSPHGGLLTRVFFVPRRTLTEFWCCPRTMKETLAMKFAWKTKMVNLIKKRRSFSVSHPVDCCWLCGFRSQRGREGGGRGGDGRGASGLRKVADKGERGGGVHCIFNCLTRVCCGL